MTFKKYEWRILVSVLLLVVTLSGGAFLLVKGWFVYLFILVPVIVYQVLNLYRFQAKAHMELQQFVESVHYRDFSRYFDVKHAPLEIQPLPGFNANTDCVNASSLFESELIVFRYGTCSIFFNDSFIHTTSPVLSS